MIRGVDWEQLISTLDREIGLVEYIRNRIIGIDWEQDQWSRLRIVLVEWIGNIIRGVDFGYLDQIGNIGRLNWEQNERIELGIGLNWGRLKKRISGLNWERVSGLNWEKDQWVELGKGLVQQIGKKICIVDWEN